MRRILLLVVLLLALGSLAGATARLSIELVPKITVRGEKGTTQWVEWSPTLEAGAVWQVLTNVALGSEPIIMVDLAVAASQRFYRVTHVPPQTNAPAGMVVVPPGPFQMGDSFNDSPESVIETPVHTVYVSAFYMDQYEVTKMLWDDVKSWSEGNGYAFGNPGDGKAANYPVHSVNWYDVVKWCNARSEKEGRVAAYFSDAALTQVYKTAELAPYVRWNAGYRLPTEAEWEKAARGGASGQRFPWSDSDTITHSRANYYSSSFYYYDVSPTRGLHPTYGAGDYMSPVGSFAANGYGLYDMAGNVWEWCWDWPDWYPSAPQTDPRGAASGIYRVVRGGGWYREAIYSRTAYRGNGTPDFRGGGSGFRSVLPTGQP